MQYAFGFFTEISKYLVILIMSLYTVNCVIMLLTQNRNPGIQKVFGVFQNILIFLLQAVFYLQMMLAAKKEEYIFFYLFVQLLLLAIVGLTHIIYEKEHPVLLSNMCMMLGIGFCMISRLDFSKAVRQLVIVGISFLIAIFLPAAIQKLHIWKKLTWGYAVAGVGALSGVLLLGEVYGGSKISYTFAGVITFQPSEFVKILFLFFLAGVLWENSGFLNVALSAVTAGLHVMVLVVSNDLGSALIFFVAYVFIVFICTRNYFYLLLGAGGGCGAAVVAYYLFDHVRIRVLAWQDPWKYIDKEGYQITQSLFAIGSGNWFGMGLFGGNPKAIPLVDRDFIFSSICEEMGVITGIEILVICVLTFLCMTEMAVKIKDKFYQMIVFGIAVVYLFQIFLTIGGGTKFIPLTGVTLPFVSYGGSSAMASLFMFYIVQGIYLMLQEQQQKGETEEDGRAERKAVCEIEQTQENKE